MYDKDLLALCAELDVDDGIRHYNSEEIYFQMLDEFRKSIPQLLETLCNQPSSGDSSDVKAVVSELGASYRKIHAKKCANDCYRLETALESYTSERVASYIGMICDTGKQLIEKLDDAYCISEDVVTDDEAYFNKLNNADQPTRRLIRMERIQKILSKYRLEELLATMYSLIERNEVEKAIHLINLLFAAHQGEKIGEGIFNIRSSLLENNMDNAQNFIKRLIRETH